MKRKKYTIGAYLYFRGDRVNPDDITNVLGIYPTDSQKKGDVSFTSTNRPIVARTGLWRLEAESDSNLVSDHVSQLLSGIPCSQEVLNGFEGVKKKYIDIFVGTLADDGGGGTVKFDLTKENMEVLAKTGMPLFVTICVVRK
jgi:hypothetical protein